MKSALLLIDVQRDFLQRKGLVPKPEILIEQLEKLVSACRELQLPIIHIHTQVRSDGSDRMPHWKRNNSWFCIEGSSGVMPPESLQPEKNEHRITKQFFSGFGSPLLDTTLQQHGIDTIIVAGLYLHGCIRSTVLDAYERNYKVLVVEEAVGSTEPEHAEITRSYLNGRVAQFIELESLLLLLDSSRQSLECHSDKATLPVANIAGEWLNSKGHSCYIRRNPSRWSEVIASVPIATEADVDLAVSVAETAQVLWSRKPSECRIALLDEWAKILQENQQQLAELLALEIGKPLTTGYDEIERTISLIQMTTEQLSHLSVQKIGSTIQVLNRPQGIIGIITPWNNPVAIPVGKIAPALAMGNAVVWKPALEAPRTTKMIIDILYQAGMPKGLLNMVCGDAKTARLVIEHPLVSAVTLTGSIATGRTVSALCVRDKKPLQAELGGNNAAIVWHDYDIISNAQQMALSAFSFSGQRCTAIQRFIVERSIAHKFETEFIKAVASLIIGKPNDKTTQLGPLISRDQRQLIKLHIGQAIQDGACLKYGNTVPQGFEEGCWLNPTVLSNVTSEMRIAHEEVFGPIALILPVDNFEAAIQIVNGVEQGLVAALYSSGVVRRRQFSEQVEAGILTFSCGPLAIHPQAPFGGWKASMIGPPEHGIWDQQFYGRIQAIYGSEHE